MAVAVADMAEGHRYVGNWVSECLCSCIGTGLGDCEAGVSLSLHN